MDNREQLVSTLIDTLRNDPASWRWREKDDRYAIVHSSGVSLWVSYEIKVTRPREIKFGFWARRRLGSAIRAWRRAAGGLQAAQLDQENVSLVLMMLRSPPAKRRVA